MCRAKSLRRVADAHFLRLSSSNKQFFVLQGGHTEQCTYSLLIEKPGKKSERQIRKVFISRGKMMH